MSEQAARVVGRYRWLICGLLFIATTINYIDRQILSLLKPILDEELKWTNTEYGVVNSVFQSAYAVSLLVFGFIIDRFGIKKGYAASIFAWSVAAIGHAFVRSVGGFYWARASLGLGEGGNFPAAIKAVATWFPKRERAFATSIFNAGTNVGAILAPALVPFVAYTWGWRSAFVIAGIAGFAWLLLWFPLYEAPDKVKSLTKSEYDHIHSDLDQNQEKKLGWLQLLGYRQTYAFMVAKLLTDPVWWFFLTWLPDYFKKTRALDIKNSAPHLITIYTIVTVLSIAGGYLTGYLNRRGYSVTRARKTGMIIFAVAVIPVVFATSAGNWEAVLLIGLAGAAHQAWSATIYTTVSDMFPKNAVASVIGLGGMAGSLGGIFFPAIAGAILDSATKAGNVSAGYGILFTVCGSAYLLAFVLNHLLAPRFEPVKIRT